MADKPSIAELQDQVVDEFAFFEDWTDKYQVLISKAKKLEAYPDELKDETHFVHGCQSQVWFAVEEKGGRLYFRAMSDSAIVSGLLALMIEVYSGQTAKEILKHPPAFIERMGLSAHLSPTRSNGLFAIVKRIQSEAQKALVQAEK